MKHRSDSEIEKFNETDKARLAEMKQKIMAVSTATVRTEVVLGNPTKVILNSIKENNCSLVVMGKTRQRICPGVYNWQGDTKDFGRK